MNSAEDFDTNSQLFMSSPKGIIKRSTLESNIIHNIEMSTDKQAETAMPRKKRVNKSMVVKVDNSIEVSRPETGIEPEDEVIMM